MKRTFNILFSIFFLWGGNAMCSAPAALEGPNYYNTFKGEVVSAKLEYVALPNSDVSNGPSTQYLVVRMKVLETATYEAATAKSLPAKMKVGDVVEYFFGVKAAIEVGDIVDGQTYDAKTLSEKWRYPFLAKEKVTKKPIK